MKSTAATAVQPSVAGADHRRSFFGRSATNDHVPSDNQAANMGKGSSGASTHQDNYLQRRPSFSCAPGVTSTPLFEVPPTPPSDAPISKELRASPFSPLIRSPSTASFGPERQRNVTPHSKPESVGIAMPVPQVAPAAEAAITSTSSWITAREILSLGELPYLNGMRALASIMIQIYHISKPNTRYLNFFASAALTTHFVQGGFLITGILLVLQSRTKEKGWAHMHEHVPQFFVGRWARLFPALIAMIFINSIWWLQRHDKPMHLAKTITRSIFKLQHTTILDVGDDPPNPFAHTWFLDVQEHFYLFWSLALPCILLLPSLGRFTVLAALFGWSARVRSKTDFFNATLGINLFKMIAGCAIQLIPFPRFMVQQQTCTFAALFMASFFAWGLSTRLNDGVEEPNQRLQGDYAGVLAVVVITLAAIAKRMSVLEAQIKKVRTEPASNIKNDGSAMKTRGNADDTDSVQAWLLQLWQWDPLTLLDTTALRFVGRISYAWYIWQVPLMHLEETFRVGRPAVGTTAEAFIVAMVSTFYLEEPIRNLYQAHRKQQRVSAASIASEPGAARHAPSSDEKAPGALLYGAGAPLCKDGHKE